MKKIKSIFAIILVLTLSLALTSCSEKSNNEDESIKGSGTGKTITAVMTTTLGDITLELYPDKAPKTVENFVTHSKNGYYNGIKFHRIIKDFMIQGGDPTATGMGGESIWGKPFADEFHPLLKNYRGALSMANSGPNTNGSQFFIVQAGPDQLDETQLNSMIKSYNLKLTDEEKAKYLKEGGTPWLDGKHTVFGYVTKGLDIVDKIASVTTDKQGKPVEDVKIISIKVNE